MSKLPKIYYAYKKMRDIWSRRPDSCQEKMMMIDAFNKSLKEIEEKYLEENEGVYLYE